ncbi:NUDIX domain-containing protein [Nocardia salmonicida]|uniref:NUDIX domain-containing protein n=1 Tax=Nocardia salmonicida TaxID=53431 RepID=UPI00369C2BB5
MAAALFVDELNRVLPVEPTYKDYWEIPGGVVEAHESPFTTVVREVREELGLDVSTGRLSVVDRVPPGRYPDDGVMMIFDGTALTTDQISAITLQADELRSWTWCDDAEIAKRLPDIMTRRVAAALRARNQRSSAYLEEPPGGCDAEVVS